jgi:hypothetical protein
VSLGPNPPRSPTLPAPTFRPGRTTRSAFGRAGVGQSLHKQRTRSSAVGGRRIGPVLSLLRQGLSLEREFGTHSLEAMLWVAETVEASVYEAGSLRLGPDGLSFALASPPLRVGAFATVRLSVNGAPVDPERVRLRTERAPEWRTSSDLDADRPVHLAPGERAEFLLLEPTVVVGSETTVRLDLTSVAIPPLVWVEFRDRVGSGGPR